MRAITCLAGVLTAVITLAAAAQPRKPAGPPPGRLVEAGGLSLHIRCVGPATGGPTVILEAGAGDYSNRWTAVQDLLAPRIRSCAYDRAGLGWSGGTQEESLSENNRGLQALLAAADVRGPYVLVGHSLGALMVRRYFSRYPDGVIGMVLAGATHENTRLFSLRANQWQRLREEASPLGADLQALYLDRQMNPAPLGDRPLIVLVGSRPDPKVTVPEEIAREKAAEQEDLPRLSRNSKLVRDPASGHHIHVDNAALVAGAIEEVVTAAAKGTKLAASQ